jgi:hypothetical protein
MTGASEQRPNSIIRQQVADVLRRARKLPVGPHRNDLRQLAMGLLWLEKHGFKTKPTERRNENASGSPTTLEGYTSLP